MILMRFRPDMSAGFAEPHVDMMERLVRAGKAFAVVAVIAQTAVHTLNAILTDSVYLSVNAENNPFAWLHGVAIFTAAAVCALAAVLTDYHRREFVALTVILSFLSLDEMIYVHEEIVARLLDALDLSTTWDSAVWPVIYLPLCGALAVLLVRIASVAPRPAGQLIFAGLALLLVAVAAEIMSAPWSNEEGGLVHTIEGAFEEAAELAGWIAIATGLTTITLAAIMPPERTSPSA